MRSKTVWAPGSSGIDPPVDEQATPIGRKAQDYESTFCGTVNLERKICPNPD
jgi:hypothetical protein